MLFVVLVASSIGVYGPILLSRFTPVKSNMFLIVLKQFGTGVIISTAFVHVCSLPYPFLLSVLIVGEQSLTFAALHPCNNDVRQRMSR